MGFPKHPRPPRSASLFRELFKGVSFYKRKVVFFGVLMVMGVLTLGFLGINPLPKRKSIRLPQIEASQIEAETLEAAELSQIPGVSLGETVWNFEAEIKKDGKIFVNGYPFKESIYPSVDFDEARLVVVSSAPGFIDEIILKVLLPEPLTTDARPPRIISKGVESASAKMLDSQTVVFTAKGLLPQATFTAILELPKGMIEFGTTERLKFKAQSLSATAWILLGAIFPLIGLLILYQIWRRLSPRMGKPTTYLTVPPYNLPPAVVGALVSGRVRVREIVATLIDLSTRGFLEIYEEKERFVIFRKKVTDRRLWTTLRRFERLLIEQLFPEGKPFSTQKLLIGKLGQQLFSREITLVWWEIYQEATSRGLFVQNPAKLHFRYKAAGLLFFFFGVLGFILGMILGAEPKFGLWLWLGVIISGFLIVRLSSRLSIRSPQGEKALNLWLAFANHLALQRPIDYQSASQGVFERYLPYAIVFNKEKEWAARFGETAFVLPSWFSSTFQVSGLLSFAEHLFPLITNLSRQFSALKEPVFE